MKSKMIFYKKHNFLIYLKIVIIILKIFIKIFKVVTIKKIDSNSFKNLKSENDLSNVEKI